MSIATTRAEQSWGSEIKTEDTIPDLVDDVTSRHDSEMIIQLMSHTNMCNLGNYVFTNVFLEPASICHYRTASSWALSRPGKARIIEHIYTHVVVRTHQCALAVRFLPSTKIKNGKSFVEAVGSRCRPELLRLHMMDFDIKVTRRISWAGLNWLSQWMRCAMYGEGKGQRIFMSDCSPLPKNLQCNNQDLLWSVIHRLCSFVVIGLYIFQKRIHLFTLI